MVDLDTEYNYPLMLNSSLVATVFELLELERNSNFIDQNKINCIEMQ